MNKIALSGMGIAALAAGCFNSQEIVTERAAREFRCPATQVQTEELGGNAYRVWACGASATYACSPRLGMCQKEPGGTTAAAQPTSLPPAETTGLPPAFPPGPPPATAPVPSPAPTPTSTTAPPPWQQP